MRPDITMVNISAVSMSVYLLLMPLGEVTKRGSFPSFSEMRLTSRAPPWTSTSPPAATLFRSGRNDGCRLSTTLPPILMVIMAIPG